MTGINKRKRQSCAAGRMGGRPKKDMAYAECSVDARSMIEDLESDLDISNHGKLPSLSIKIQLISANCLLL